MNDEELAEAMYQGFVDGMAEHGVSVEEIWDDLDEATKGGWLKAAQVARFKVITS